jgi:hypothetical protein
MSIVACSLFAYLFSVTPAAASVVYCISDDGHSGFELVPGGDRGCASCCHEVPSGPGHEGFPPEPAECTDIALSSDQAIRAGAALEPGAVTFAPEFVATLHPPTRLEKPTVESVRALLVPPRSSPAVLLRHVVLLI